MFQRLRHGVWPLLAVGALMAVIARPAMAQATPGTLQFSAATYSAGEGVGSANITITRTGGSDGIVGVSFSTSDGTAIAAADYTATTTTVSFADGDSATKTVAIPILEDVLVEGSETVNLTLSGPTGGASLGSPSSAVLTILDNDLAGSLQFGASTYSVGEGAGSASVTITRTGGSIGVVGVTLSTSDGSAMAPADYAATTVAVSFADGDTATKTVSIPIVDDILVEGNETFNAALTLSSPTGGATLGSPSSAVVTIIDNDPAPVPGSLQLSSTTYSAGEGAGSAAIMVTRTGGSNGAVSGVVSTSNGTALSGSDYAAAAATVSFADGDAVTKTVSISILEDALVEGNETVNVTLSGLTGGATLGSPSSAVLTIIDNDPTPGPAGSLQFSSATYSVMETASSATIMVTRAGGSTGAVSGMVSTSNGTALAGTDYITTTMTVSFADGDSATKTVSIPILDDVLVEGNETVSLTLSSPIGGATLGSPSSAVLTIVDNDPAAGPSGDNERPGWGCGDKNHIHTGPPGNSEKASPCGHRDDDDVDNDDVHQVSGVQQLSHPDLDQDDHHGDKNNGRGKSHGR